jgi:hypothetical protein
MKSKTALFVSLALVSAVFVIHGQTTSPQQQSSSPPETSPLAPKALIDQYCVGCHNQKAKASGLPQGVLTLDDADIEHAGQNGELWEKVVRKLRAGMMPPSGARRPDKSAINGLITWLENELDRNATLHVPPPGLHRLNRTEYANVVHDLLALDIDATKLLPSDDSTHGFDNMAGTLGLSPTLLEAYVSAAEKISRLALGDVSAPSQVVYRAPEDTSQDYHIEGLPFGTRGGLIIKHEFPADGEYTIKVVPISKGNMGNTNPFGEVSGEKLEILLDGERLALLNFGGGGGGFGGPRGDKLEVRFPAQAGLHTVGATFLATNYAPILDLNEHFLRSTIETGGLPGFTFFPHVGSVRIEGPYGAAGAGETPSRQKVFVCRPAKAQEEEACAKKIISTFVTRAFRRPATPADVNELMDFYQTGRHESDFDHGVQMALQRILADPRFIYRIEGEPAGLQAGQTYRVSDLELASRLSFFLWSTGPDDELIKLASQNKLKDPKILEQQVKRMLADPRSEALAVNFAGQWLNLRGMQSVGPLPKLFPDFDDNLRQAFRRETELFFDNIVREDQSVKDLLTADYTFVNERLAKHYGIPNVYGARFRRVTLGPDLDVRRGLLGKGAILTTTSQPGRTSPVTRGKWILTNLLGVPPPDPPANVPPLKPKMEDQTGNAKEPSMRQKMLDHRIRADCVQCHKLMDPIGFSLENFDGIATWRTQDEGNAIDASDVVYDGTKIEGPAGLRQWILGYSDQFVRVVSEKLLTYALGRGTEYYDMPVVRSIVRDAARDDYRFSSLVLGIVKSAPFQMNMKVQATEQQ